MQKSYPSPNTHKSQQIISRRTHRSASPPKNTLVRRPASGGRNGARKLSPATSSTD